jgi:hypothetical protein
MTKKALFIILPLIILASCDFFEQGYDYTFINQTLYSIKITIPTKDQGSFNLAAKHETKISIKSDTIDFEWTAVDPQHNYEIYPVKESGTVTFKLRN